MSGGVTATDGVAAALAHCILRAENASNPGSGIYWHTREACLPVAREHGIPWTDVLKRVEEGRWTSRSVIERVSAPFWADVAHPDLIVREVMES